MKKLAVQIVWFDDEDKILQADSDTPIEDLTEAHECLEVLVDMCRTMSSLGQDAMSKDGIDWQRRSTRISMSNGKRSRSLTFEQPREVTDEEADRWAKQMVAWVLATDTTDLLDA